MTACQHHEWEVVMYRNILVPFDGSEPSQRALKAALEMSSSSVPVVITVLKVAAPMNFDDSTFEVAARMAGVPKIDAEVLDATRDNYNNEHRKGVQTQIQGFFASVPDNIDIQIVIENGRPQDVICDYANEHGIDCIAMGRRGLGVIRAALGSVSSAVLRGIDLPVLVVK
jgi:nucleotide-binding universal stress UspA family protein